MKKRNNNNNMSKVTYGLTQSNIRKARLVMQAGLLDHDVIMKALKDAYRRNRLVYAYGGKPKDIF